MLESSPLTLLAARLAPKKQKPLRCDARDQRPLRQRVCSCRRAPAQREGEFEPGVSYHAGVPVYELATGDFNQDGKQDLAALGPEASILLNTR